METTTIRIDGMSCQGCASSVRNALLALPGVEEVEVSLEKAQASVSFDPDRVDRNLLNQVVEEAGFDPA